uniref:Thioredoxin n=1 Tax=Mastacembelus armatus TaxID=205130 RepID=A0A7N8YI91_9TELE
MILDEFRALLKEAGDKLVVVDFSATWCGPCKKIAPEYEDLSKKPENKNVVFLKVDVDEAEDVSTDCGISCMPTFHFYKNGKKLHIYTKPTGSESGIHLNEMLMLLFNFISTDLCSLYLMLFLLCVLYFTKCFLVCLGQRQE